jgi:hypothetical protein
MLGTARGDVLPDITLHTATRYYRASYGNRTGIVLPNLVVLPTNSQIWKSSI